MEKKKEIIELDNNDAGMKKIFIVSGTKEELDAMGIVPFTIIDDKNEKPKKWWQFWKLKTDNDGSNIWK